MSSTRAPDPSFMRAPRMAAATEQGLLPSRYSRQVQLLALAAFTLAFAGWLNDTWLFLFESPIWLNRYTEYALILAFGLWRIRAEQDPYTRRRLIILVAVVTGFWWLLPWLMPTFEPYVGYLWAQPVFPSLHVPGTLTFALVIVLVLLFGRRVICGFGCPCVGIRETVGFPFRGRTLRGEWARRLRHSKWLFFVVYVGVMVATQYPPNSWTLSLVGGFYLVVALTYFGSFFLAPITGNRFYCRTLCPYGATFGVLNHTGFYDLRMDPARCIDCGRCDQACDMGIPVHSQGKASGHVTGLEDCMGCARCVASCPTDALEIRDVRNLLWPKLRRDASHLLAGAAKPPPAVARAEVTPLLSAQAIRVQAARCLDCGEPGCRAACPLANPIPEWLALAAKGDLPAAATLAQSTNPLPEFCGALCPHERLCEGACARAKQGEGAVTIGAIEHGVFEHAFASGWRPMLAPRKRVGRSAAVIGAGPAGLAFADFANRAGWQVRVIDSDERIGGMLSSGLPAFRFDKQALARRQHLLEHAGVQFELGTVVDGPRFAALLAGHDAVFVGLGARAPRPVALPGRDMQGVMEALDYLAQVNGRDGGGLAGRRVLVLGGGDTTMDCARAARRQRAAQVRVAYRGPAQRLRASAQELEAAVGDGVRFAFEHTPVAVTGSGAVDGVRFRVGDDPESHDQTLACDAVILAFGQQAHAPEWLGPYGVVAADGTLQIDADGRSAHPKIFAGGDCAHGPDLIVTAAAAGRRAAEAALADQVPVRRLLRRIAARPALAATTP